MEVTKLTIQHNPFCGGSRSGPRPGDLWDLMEPANDSAWSGSKRTGHLETVLSVMLPTGQWDCYVVRKGP